MSADCDGGLPCVNGVCAHCRDDGDCRAWEGCDTAGACVVDAGRCNGDYDCEAWDACDGTHTCVHRPGRCPWTQACAAWETCGSSHLCTLAPGRCITSDDCRAWASCDPTNTCAVNTANGGDVVLWGTLSEGACYLGAVAPVSAPQEFVVGSDCYSDGSGSVLSPTGDLLYYAHTKSALARYVPDSLWWDGSTSRWKYPDLPEANDVALPGPASPAACADTATVAVQATTGDVIYGCTNAGGGYDYFTGAGVAVAGLTGTWVRSWNAAGHKLVSAPTLAVVSPAGLSTTVIGLGSGDAYRVARATGGGFRLATEDSGGTWRRWSVATNGVATFEGTYATTLGGYTVGAGSAMDADGNLYAFAYTGLTDVVVRLPLQPASPILVYSEANAPAGANDWTSASFDGYVKVHASQLLTSP